MPVWVRPRRRRAPKPSPIGPGTGRRRRTGPFATGFVPLDADPCRSPAIVAGPARPSTDNPRARWKYLTEVSVAGPNTAAIASLHCATAERRTPALAQRAPRLRADDAVHREPAAALESHDRGLGERAANAVHGRVAETDSLQRDLHRRDLGTGDGLGG